MRIGTTILKTLKTVLSLLVGFGPIDAAVASPGMVEEQSPFSIGIGADEAGPVGLDVYFDSAIVRNANNKFSLGLEYATRGYRFQANSLDARNSNEVLLYLKYAQPVVSSISLFERVGAGEVFLPRPASKQQFNVLDIDLGVRVSTHNSYVELGSGLREAQVSSPVQVGVEQIDRSLMLYPKMTLGLQF